MDNTNAQEENWESQLIDYTMGLLEGEEAASFAARLAECREHVQMAQKYEQTMSWMGVVASAAEPPAGHKSRLMSRISATPQEQSASPSMPSLPSVLNTTTLKPAQPIAERNDSVPATSDVTPTPISISVAPAETDSKVVDLAAYRASRRNSIVIAIGTIAAALILVFGLSGLFNQNNKLVIPSGYQTVQLAPQAGFESASAVVLYDPTKNDATLLTTGFPQLPAGKVYELWELPVSSTGAPVAAGTFVPDASGATRHDTKAPQTVGTYAGFAVTLEDAPGGTAPKGSMVVVGTFVTHQ